MKLKLSSGFQAYWVTKPTSKVQSLIVRKLTAIQLQILPEAFWKIINYQPTFLFDPFLSKKWINYFISWTCSSSIPIIKNGIHPYNEKCLPIKCPPIDSIESLLSYTISNSLFQINAVVKGICKRVLLFTSLLVSMKRLPLTLSKLYDI